MHLGDYFDRVFIINLKSRPDRWDRIEKHLRRHRITNYERFEAVKFREDDDLPRASIEAMTPRPDIPNYTLGALGCKLSHLGIIELASHRGYRSVLVLEDDAEFLPSARRTIDRALREIEPDWGMLYLGANHVQPPQPCSRHVGQVTRTYATHAYAVSSRLFEPILEGGHRAGTEIDVFYADVIQAKYPCFCVDPRVAIQAASFSDILGQEIDYRQLVPPKRRRIDRFHDWLETLRLPFGPARRQSESRNGRST